MVGAVWYGTLLAFVVFFVACNSADRPTAPTFLNLPSPVGPTFTLSGVITERFSGRPVQGGRVWVWPFSFRAGTRLAS